MNQLPRYLGDAVYVSRDDLGRLVITTDHHEPALAGNTIVLEDEIWEALKAYAEPQP